MSLAASCPRCASALTEIPGVEPTCPLHGAVPPLWRPGTVDYAGFAELIGLVGDLPTYLPWPMSPGWSVTGFGCVGSGEDVVATVTSVAGPSDLDGDVELTLVVEDPGVGLGARCAHTPYDDPGPLIEGSAAVHVRAGGRNVALWLVEQPDTPGEDVLSRAVFAGEADGRWLWLVIRPGSAALLLGEDWLLADVTGFGPEMLEVEFGGPRPQW